MICASVYLLVSIRNFLVHLAEKILFLQPLNVGGDYPVTEVSSLSSLVHNESLSIFYRMN
jgi:hypothetical protein